MFSPKKFFLHFRNMELLDFGQSSPKVKIFHEETFQAQKINFKKRHLKSFL